MFRGLCRNIQYQQRPGRCDNQNHYHTLVIPITMVIVVAKNITTIIVAIFDIILNIENHFEITMTLPILVDKAVAWSLL